MKTIISLLAGGGALLGATAAAAQSTTATSGPMNVTGNVPALCSAGSVLGGTTNFDLGVLTDASTGLLRTDLTAPSRTMSGAFCSSRSRIEVVATPLVAQNNPETPAAGFSRSVHYTATASGWTVTPAAFQTGAATNTASVQQRTTAFQGDIAVAIGSFATAGGSNLRLVADPSYQGTVTVTLSVAE